MTLHYCLLDESLIRARLAADGTLVRYTLPGLFVALSEDAVRDFPALRPHQRHPWHAFLVQLAAMTLHRAGRTQPLDSEEEWRAALLALTSECPDGAAWCLVAPHERPAFMQAPVPDGDVAGWGDDTPTPDMLDILITSKNHDLKQKRIRSACPDDWVFALVSLQTAAPFPGRGNYGIARMNGGSSSRPGLGIEPPGGPGRRWQRDVRIALAERSDLVARFEYRESEGVSLLWLEPWDGKTAYAFSALDPFFVEISRRVRLIRNGERLKALRTTSDGPRISKAEAQSRKGNTGDLWTPIDIAEAKSLGVASAGFDYRRTVELLFGTQYRKPPAQQPEAEDDLEGLAVLARAIAGGQSKTDGYHERRIPLSRTVRKRLIERQTDQLAAIAGARVQAIGKIRSVLWSALATLFDNGATKDKFSDSAKEKASKFSTPFEQGEDARFFDELNAEIEAVQPDQVRMNWYLDMAGRAELILQHAFNAGPRSGEQRYRARAAALARFRGGLRSDKVLPELADYYRLKYSKETPREPA